MEKLIKLVVLAAIVYFGVTVGYPWVKDRLAQAGSSASSSSSGSGGTGGDRCVGIARQASDSFADAVLRYGRPPGNPDAWGQASGTVYGQISSARSACSCAQESCREASKALDRLDGMVSDFDRGVRGGQPPLNLARGQNEVDDLLNRALRLSRSGK